MAKSALPSITHIDNLNFAKLVEFITSFCYRSCDSALTLDTFYFSTRLKSLEGFTVFDYFNSCWNNEQRRFNHVPRQQFEGLDCTH